ncbi:hypothetical protein NX862_01800 [Rhodobacter sp. KR11]|uniref:tetratricopeptide repeat protein n=1 Tax=Rhodobacter sp. KR11 TaxID=2974588 RepID=UPI0022221049|nr:hypothetical protein [Rhodobacter sp. KR11]MCW1917480.1 hypothetical protein [Rhodobacter sp. KR11]
MALTDAMRHPWLAKLEAAPLASVSDFLAGYADVRPFNRVDAPDAATMLVGHLPADDPAREALGAGLLEWLDTKRASALPNMPPKLQDYIRQVCEAFQIVALLDLKAAAHELRKKYVVWFAWASQLDLGPSRDARASYLRMLANTQITVADLQADGDSLAPFWTRLCREAGSQFPAGYLQIGLLGLRRLPSVKQGGQPWIGGLATWALAHNPSKPEFLAEWYPLKRLHPTKKDTVRQLIFDTLSSDPFASSGVTPPGWWENDADFREDKQTQSVAPNLFPPPKWVHEGIISDLEKNQSYSKLLPKLNDMVSRHEAYKDATGNGYFLVRSFCNIGSRLLKSTGDSVHERARFAEKLARAALQHEPGNLNGWGLWRDSLFNQGAFEASVAIGWEAIKRLPDDPLKRTGLAEVLIALDRSDEALEIVTTAMDQGICHGLTYAIAARIYDSKGNRSAALNVLTAGLKAHPDDSGLLKAKMRFDQVRPLSLVSGAKESMLKAIVSTDPDDTLIALERSGRLRQLRPRLTVDQTAMAELKRTLSEDPTFAYAQLLAARHSLWRAEEHALPPFAAAFEEALAEADVEKLKALAEQMPRMASLILLARAILGDMVAAREVSGRLANPHRKDDAQVSTILRGRFKPVADLIEGGTEPLEAIGAHADHLRLAIYDANEAVSSVDLFVA